MTNHVYIYDTTLRDGMQAEGLQLSVPEKVRLSEVLDDFGVDYIEGGWPGSNPRDEEFFDCIRRSTLKHTRVAAFGSTRRAKLSCKDDPSIQALLHAETPVVTVFGKSWKFHATHALGITPEVNLELIEDSVAYLVARVSEVIFDAEHFFDGFADDPAYALACLRAAQAGGAKWLVLCDTNGGRLPSEVHQAVAQVCTSLQTPVGIHAHNDAELGVANSIAAVQAGARMVQGTINGIGERCGNANLISIIAGVELKLGLGCVPSGKLTSLTRVSRIAAELMNLSLRTNQAYVGDSAFAHKGGVHVDAVLKDSRTYEHIVPEKVGNRRRVLVSDLSGRANVFAKAREQGVELDPKEPHAKAILAQMKHLESQGYQFEGAEASFSLLVDEALGKAAHYFRLLNLEVGVQLRESEEASATSTVKVSLEVGGERGEATASGNGPVHAMDAGVRQVLMRFYPALRGVRLLDYKVRVLTTGKGTESVVRVLVRSGDGDQSWGTVGVSPNIIEASWQAIADALRYKLIKDEVQPPADKAANTSNTGHARKASACTPTM